MADTRNIHNAIVVNTIIGLQTRLRGKSYRTFNSDTKIRIRLFNHQRFYFPDASVICRLNPPNDSYQDEPVAIFEVLSRNARRIDEVEKKDAYLTIPSLKVYVLIEQDTAAVVAFRRTEGDFVREVYLGMDATLPLAEIGIDLPLAEIYEGVDFITEPEDDPASS
jgi:Uma2 family endonuclease